MGREARKREAHRHANGDGIRGAVSRRSEDAGEHGREIAGRDDVGPDPEALLWVPPATFVSAIDGDQVVVWTGGVRQVVRGRSARLVSTLLARAREGAIAGDLVASVAAEDPCSEDEVWAVVACLFDRGILDHREVDDPREERGPSGPPDELARQHRYLSLFTSHPSRAEASIRGATVDVQAEAAFGCLVRDRLRASGVGAVRLWSPEDPIDAEALPGREPTASLAVLAGASSGDERMLARNDEWVERGRPFLAVTLPSGSARVGPFVIPRESACLRCVAEAEQRLRPELPPGLVLPKERPPATDLAALPAIVAAVVALEVVKALTGLFLPALANRRLFIEPSSLTFASEEVFKLARCPSCGRAARHVETEPFEMASPPWAERAAGKA
jgi:bacteriocin biosynthesis cyclodehydratase domain-containing protein